MASRDDSRIYQETLPDDRDKLPPERIAEGRDEDGEPSFKLVQVERSLNPGIERSVHLQKRGRKDLETDERQWNHVKAADYALKALGDFARAGAFRMPA